MIFRVYDERPGGFWALADTECCDRGAMGTRA
jgi:hypothetical protein